MLSPTLDTIRLFIHVLAAAIWVGGQFTLTGALPGLREVGPDATKAAANGFARVAWPAFGVAVVTGMWGIFASSETSGGYTSSGYMAVLGIKVLLVVAAGGSAFAHAATSNRGIKAATGALGGLFSLAILFLGVLLTTHA